MVDSYPGSFSQIFNNLILNSLLHAYDYEDTGTISIIFSGDGTNLKMIFSDDGRGIPAKNLDQIFEPFFSTAHDKGGTGLGLNIVYNIVTNTLCGSIKCESTESKGTVFTITIPLESVGEEDSSDE